MSAKYSAPSHNLHDHIAPNIWPPSSPDLNTLSYYGWSAVEREANMHPHNRVDSLKEAITRVMTHMEEDHLIRPKKRFRQRIESVIAAEGDFVE